MDRVHQFNIRNLTETRKIELQQSLLNEGWKFRSQGGGVQSPDYPANTPTWITLICTDEIQKLPEYSQPYNKDVCSYCNLATIIQIER